VVQACLYQEDAVPACRIRNGAHRSVRPHPLPPCHTPPFHTPFWPNFKNWASQLHFSSRLKLQTDRNDFIYHILNSKGPTATPKEIASHYNVIMMAGAVTTATFLSGALYFLCHNRPALQRLQDEMRGTFPTIKAINSKDLMKCSYLNASLKRGCGFIRQLARRT
jgi:Cytochrome P450